MDAEPATAPTATPDTARLFLALWPGPAERTLLTQQRDAWRWRPHTAVMRPEKLHLTLHFIGNVERARLAELGAGLAVGFEPFDLGLGVPELWPRGIAVLRPDELPEALQPLQQLHAQLGAALQRLGLAVEARVYRPHITFARRAAGAQPPESASAWCWRVERYALVESVRGRRAAPGDDYRVLQLYAGGAPSLEGWRRPTGP